MIEFPLVGRIDQVADNLRNNRLCLASGQSGIIDVWQDAPVEPPLVFIPPTL